MWSDLDARIETEFKAFQKESLAAFGNLYLSQLKQKNQYKNSTLISSQFHNATYIKFGSRNLGIAKIPHKNNEPLAISSEVHSRLNWRCISGAFPVHLGCLQRSRKGYSHW
ncbi:hypothetical protein [Vibrio cholerae]|uniref:hypothetical protein n=1 Tax=Vibrio cholerae TaxID=666 RepID=UPI003D7DEA96